MDLEDIQVLLGTLISLLQQLVTCQQRLEGHQPKKIKKFKSKQNFVHLHLESR